MRILLSHRYRISMISTHRRDSTWTNGKRKKKRKNREKNIDTLITSLRSRVRSVVPIHDTARCNAAAKHVLINCSTRLYLNAMMTHALKYLRYGLKTLIIFLSRERERKRYAIVGIRM